MSDLAYNWSVNYPDFSESEFRCRHSGKIGMKHDFMLKLQTLRDRYAKPMRITSGYRDKTHPLEVSKVKVGAHPSGMAVDIAVELTECHTVLALAMSMGFTGIGLQQKGDGRFIHLDTIPSGTIGFIRPTVWTY